VADPDQLPPRLAWIGDDALLLAPYVVDAEHWGGFLIAEAEAAGQRRLLHSEDGETLELVIPAAVASAGAVMAEAGSILPIAESPPAPHCDGPPPQQSSGSNPG
jgi:hypothetical protein